MIDIKKARRIPKNADLSRIHPDLRDKAVPCSLLTAHPDNPRVHPEANKRAIAGSLKRFQQRNLIVVNRTDAGLRIEAHHEVFRQMLQLGSEYVAVAIMEDDPLTELGFLLADNRTGDLSEDDPEKLAPILRQLIDAGEEVEEIGWDEATVKGLLRDAKDERNGDESSHDDDNPQTDRADELQKEWQTARGQVWEIVGKQTHRVMCGDSTSAEDVKKLLDGASPWMMVADPPYGVEYDPKWRDESLVGGGKSRTPNKMTGTVQNDDRAGWEAAYALFPGTVAYVWHAGLFASQVAADLHAVDMLLRAQIVWIKPHFAISRGDYHWQHEPCWYAVRKGQASCRTDDRTQSTVWEIKGMGVFGASADASDAKTGHGTQKPVECMARPIRNHIFPAGACVYDPFLGSGTTLIAAEREGKPCRGMEISPAYVAVILQRAKDAGMSPRLADA